MTDEPDTPPYEEWPDRCPKCGQSKAWATTCGAYHANNDCGLRGRGVLKYQRRAAGTPSAEEIFVLRSGRRVYDQNTDQPGTQMVIRTVTKNQDGTQADRPRPAVQVSYAGSEQAAQFMADGLDRVGYLPPETPVSQEQFEAMVEAAGVGPLYSVMLWWVVCKGLPVGGAVRQVLSKTGRDARNAKVELRRWLNELGWGSTVAENASVDS